MINHIKDILKKYYDGLNSCK